MAPRPTGASPGARTQGDDDGDEFLREPQGSDEGNEGQDGDEETGPEDDAALDAGAEQAPGDEEALEGDDDADFFPVAKPTRGQNRIQRLQNEINDLKRQLTRPAGPTAPVQPATPAGAQEETDEQFAARIALLPPDERLEAKQDRWHRRQEQREAIRAFSQAQDSDRQAFEAKCATDRRYERWADRVEEERVRLANLGQFVSRENILAFLLGKRMLSTAGLKSGERDRAQRQERVRRQETRPANARGDVTPNRRETSAKAARNRRLENMQI